MRVNAQAMPNYMVSRDKLEKKISRLASLNAVLMLEKLGVISGEQYLAFWREWYGREYIPEDWY